MASLRAGRMSPARTLGGPLLTDSTALSVADSPARPSLRLFGGFALYCGARGCSPAYDKGRALLAYLAVAPDAPHSRVALAAMFWPELPRPSALANLRQVLHDLRRSLAAAGLAASALQADRDSIRLASASLDIDTAAFAAPVCAATRTPASCGACLAILEELAGRYRGEFMAGFSLDDCPEFEDWLRGQREALHLRALGLLERLADCPARFAEPDKSLPFALRLLELEPANEPGLCRAMRLLARTGRTADALALYGKTSRALDRELGMPLAAETRALADSLRRGDGAALLGEASSPRAGEPARRQLTVLSCDLASPDGNADPDAALRRLREPQARCADIIRRHHGTPVQTFGGSLLAYFGYPQAQENAARMAVQAARAIVGADLAGIEARVGVHTGMVISGGEPPLPDASGIATRTAIALRQRVAAGTVAVSAATARLAAGCFDYADLGNDVWRVVGETGAASRLEAAADLTPLVGREAEIAALVNEWRLAAAGRRRAVLLSGDAGIGKSRMVLALRAALDGQPHVIRELRCAAEYRNSRHYPLIGLFASLLDIAAGDAPELRADKLAAYVDRYWGTTQPDALPVLARLLDLPLPAGCRESALAPQRQRELGHELLLQRIRELARSQPVLLVTEDLHWADPSTLELLGRLLAGPDDLPVLALFTARPAFEPPWAAGLVRTLALAPLDARLTGALVAAVAPALPAEQVGAIVARADGIPLFAEELAREMGSGTVATIPGNLRDLLAARLDALGPARKIAQAAATIGRVFHAELLAAVVSCDESELPAHLVQLRDAGLIDDNGHGGWQFRHVLMRDAAYDSQTRDERETRHRRTAAALRVNRAAAWPERLAQHHAAGNEPREAVACWLAAGKAAARHAASREALGHFRAGLALLSWLPEGADRARLELDLQIGLGAVACAAEGYASAAGAAAYARARGLCEQGQGTSPELFPAVWGLWASASSTGGYEHALRLARRLLRLAQAGRDPIHLQQARFALGNTLFWRGDFAAARRQLEAVEALYRPLQHERHVAEFGEDAGVTAAAYLSWVLHYLGDADAAVAASARSLALARRLGHPMSLAYALTFAALLRCRRREAQAALVLADETIILAARHGYALWQIGGALARGWAQAQQGRAEGVEAIRGCIEATRAAMGGVTLVVLEPLADACLALGDREGALFACDEALALGARLGDHHADAELNRIRTAALAFGRAG